MMKRVLGLTIGALFATAFSAAAATSGTLVGTFDGNDPCPELNGQKTDISSVIGSSVCLAKFNWNKDKETSANSAFDDGENGSLPGDNGDDLTDNFTLKFLLSGNESKSGTWSYDDQGEGYVLTHLVLKAGQLKNGGGFRVYALNGLTSGDWMTSDLANKGISHISFYGYYDPSTDIPVPASLPILMGGLGLLAFVRRKKA